MTPPEIVTELDRWIVGQPAAKRAVAAALRTRWRRKRVEPEELRAEIVPKNIMLIGPTGCGKTEIARRLAKMADAPFVKVEATKYTEVGFHGRDVDTIVEDLVAAAHELVKARARRDAKEAIEAAVEARIVEALVGHHATEDTKETFRKLYREGALDDRVVEVDLPRPRADDDGQPGVLLGAKLVLQLPRAPRGGEDAAAGGQGKRRMRIAEARAALQDVVAEGLMDAESLKREAVRAAEEDGIVFIDEIDKIVTVDGVGRKADASAEGVQRDLLPILEGSAVSTKLGTVRTDHVLFVASGAFHHAKPSDMMAELQGRLPIRVELQALTRQDFERVLTLPGFNMLKQQTALLATEGIELSFSDDAITEIAAIAADVNTHVENIGARRLHTVIERVMEDINFNATELAGTNGTIQVDAKLVRERLSDVMKKQDLSRFVL